MADVVAFGGVLPARALKGVYEHRGVYKKRSELVNGRPSYIQVDGRRGQCHWQRRWQRHWQRRQQQRCGRGRCC